MIEELLVVFFFVLLFGFVLWALIGLIHMPVFSKDMVSFLFAADEEKLEAQVRAYGWLREEKKNSARLVIVDCGMTAEGPELVRRLQKERPWLDYCPYRALPDHIELLQHCLEKGEEL